ncbi:hypothetical protein BGX27_007838 [Mortierella sp. AM989]|nr:hypothetical protein BGX27_007838 [Mortierella sp. AM989]
MDFMNAYQEQQSDRYDDDKNDAVQKVNSVAPPQESEIHEAQAAHQKVYKNGESASDDELGKAAAVEAFNEYEKAEKEGGERGGGQGTLVAMAMAQAMKLLGGGNDDKDKSTILKSASEMAMKLFMGKSSGDGSSGGGSGGGLAALMSNPQVAGVLSNPQVSEMLKKFM